MNSGSLGISITGQDKTGPLHMGQRGGGGGWNEQENHLELMVPHFMNANYFI